MQQFAFRDQRLWCRRSEGRLSWLADKHHLFSVIQNLEEKLKGQEKKGGVLKMGGDGGGREAAESNRGSKRDQRTLSAHLKMSVTSFVFYN